MRPHLLFLSSFLAVCSIGANVCNDCAQQYATVKAYAITVTNNLERSSTLCHTCIFRNQHISDQVQNIRSWYSSTGTSIPHSVESACYNADNYVLQNSSDLSLISQQVNSSLASANSILSTLDSFDCSCSSNSCGCASILTDIYDSVSHIDNACFDYFDSMYLTVKDLPIYLEDLVANLNSIYYSLYDLRNKILHPDDDYISDLAYISSQIVQSANLPPSLAFDLASGRLSGDTDRNNIELGIGYLYSAEYQHMLISRRSNQTLTDILNVISNIHIGVTNTTKNKWIADLAFISNYLYNIQQNYFRMFNVSGLYYSHYYQPFDTSGQYAYMTNFYSVCSDPSASWSDKRSAMAKFSVISTNYFRRIEYLLYGLAGFYDLPQNHNVPRADSVTNQFSNLLRATNNFANVDGIFSLSNQAETVVSQFRNLVNAFDFGSSSLPSATLTLCPSFQIGNFEFSGVSFEMYDISEVLDAIRVAFQFLWTIGFSILGIGLAAKFFYHLGKAVRDVFILLKTLL